MRLFDRWRTITFSSLAETASVRTCGALDASEEVDFLVWAGGDPERAAPALRETLEHLRREVPGGYVTFLLDGPEWARLASAWTSAFPNRREIRLRRATDLPQLLYGLGLAGSAHPYVAFLWPGCAVSGEGLRSLRNAAANADLVYGELASPVPAELYHPVQHGWLQMADLIPMHNCLLSQRTGVRFDPSPLLQSLFWWDFTLRLSREGTLAHVPVEPAAVAWDWRSYPFRHPEAGDSDVAARYLARGEERTPQSFRRDLPSPDRKPIRITLLSGLLDAHQNQLFFYSFFNQVAGQGLLSWRTILYDRCKPEDLAGCDLAIFSRPRFPQVPALLDACVARGVPALLMIDDNWIAAGREFPRFERLFTPGKPAFEIFLDALRRADAVLVFNPVLEEEVHPYARRVLRLPASVDLDLFAAPPAPRDPGFLAGFAGSPRFETSGFRGLARFLARRPDARLLVMAHEVPEELRSVPAARLTFVPWQHNYAAYARALAGLRPDVLIAPLDPSRFSASKIPIKLLESAAVGAAGIYSRLPPYTDHVRDGETGLLVENDEEAWASALERLHDDADLRRRLAESAVREVRERFTTERVLPAFLEVLQIP